MSGSVGDKQVLPVTLFVDNTLCGRDCLRKNLAQLRPGVSVLVLEAVPVLCFAVHTLHSRTRAHTDAYTFATYIH